MWLTAASACDKTPVDLSFTDRRLAGKMRLPPVAGTDLSGDGGVSNNYGATNWRFWQHKPVNRRLALTLCNNERHTSLAVLCSASRAASRRIFRINTFSWKQVARGPEVDCEFTPRCIMSSGPPKKWLKESLLSFSNQVWLLSYLALQKMKWKAIRMAQRRKLIVLF